MANRTITIPNISCGHCVATIERELSEITGVNGVLANLEKKQITVDWDEDETSWPAIQGTLLEAGFPPAE
jgi:copper chaperone